MHGVQEKNARHFFSELDLGLPHEVDAKNKERIEP